MGLIFLIIQVHYILRIFCHLIKFLISNQILNNFLFIRSQLNCISNIFQIESHFSQFNLQCLCVLLFPYFTLTLHLSNQLMLYIKFVCCIDCLLIAILLNWYFYILLLIQYHFFYLVSHLVSKYSTQIQKLIKKLATLNKNPSIRSMGNQSAKAECPTHKNQKIKYLCQQQKCIEPLCQQCIKFHRTQHQKAGFSPSIVPITKILNQHQQFNKNNRKNFKKQDQIHQTDGDFIPTGYLLKKMTKQYFLKRQKNIPSQQKSITEQRKRSSRIIYDSEKQKSKMNRSLSSSSSETQDVSMNELKKKKKLFQIVQKYEIYRKMETNPKIKQKVVEFLKKNLVLNEGIVGKEYSHLYK